jgi:multicomponent Na+:H+ antiporter subunit G
MTGLQLASVALLGAGVLVAVASSLGALWLPSVRDRIHFLTPVTSLAGPLVGAALALANGWSTTTGQVLLIVALLAVTGPVLQTATGRLTTRGDKGADEPGTG